MRNWLVILVVAFVGINFQSCSIFRKTHNNQSISESSDSSAYKSVQDDISEKPDSLPLNPTPVVIAETPKNVKWHTIEEALELNKKEPRKMVIDVYTDWCGWCKVMDKQTFSNNVIAGYLNEKYYPVKLNAEQKDSINAFGHTFKYISEGSRGVHELAYALLNGKLGYPSIVFMDEESKVIYLEQRFIKAKEFDQMIKFIGGDHYKSTKYEEWLPTYSSPILQEKE